LIIKKFYNFINDEIIKNQTYRQNAELSLLSSIEEYNNENEENHNENEENFTKW
jgi:hypothetical protein